MTIWFCCRSLTKILIIKFMVEGTTWFKLNRSNHFAIQILFAGDAENCPRNAIIVQWNGKQWWQLAETRGQRLAGFGLWAMTASSPTSSTSQKCWASGWENTWSGRSRDCIKRVLNGWANNTIKRLSAYVQLKFNRENSFKNQFKDEYLQYYSYLKSIHIFIGYNIA